MCNTMIYPYTMGEGTGVGGVEKLNTVTIPITAVTEIPWC